MADAAPTTTAPALADKLYDAIKDVLEGHRLTHTEDTSSGEAFPLIDALCPPESKDIEKGRDEIVMLCDAIYNEVLTKLLPAAASGEAPTQDQRAAFEAYFLESRRGRGQRRLPTFARLQDGTYADDHTQRHWWTWQQALAAQAAASVEATQFQAWWDALPSDGFGGSTEALAKAAFKAGAAAAAQAAPAAQPQPELPPLFEDLPPMPQPIGVDAGGFALYSPEKLIGFARAAQRLAIAAEREACAKVCEATMDKAEQNKADERARAAKTPSDKLARLQHWSTVSTFNAGLRNAAQAIRERGATGGATA